MRSNVRWITSFRSTAACSPGPLRANVSRFRTIRPARSACSNHPQVPTVLRPEILLLEQELGQSRDRCEGVVELVRDARDELPHGGELLALDQLRLERLLI